MVVVASSSLVRVVDITMPRLPRPPAPMLFLAVGAVKFLPSRPANSALSLVVGIVKVMLPLPLLRASRPQGSIVNYRLAKEPRSE